MCSLLLLFVFVADDGGGGRLMVLCLFLVAVKMYVVCSLMFLFVFVVDVGIRVGCVVVVGCSCWDCCWDCCWTCCWLCTLRLMFVLTADVGGGGMLMVFVFLAVV